MKRSGIKNVDENYTEGKDTSTDVSRLSYLCHAYFRVLYEIHSGTFLQQLMKAKGNKYFGHSN
jgi:hypothetical protein